MDLSLVKAYLRRADFTPDESWRLLDWCLTRGADEFTVSRGSTGRDSNPLFLRAFDRAMAPFARPPGRRRTLGEFKPRAFWSEVPLWELCADSIRALRAFLPSGLFSWYERDDAWLGSPIVYRRGELMLGVSGEEEEGYETEGLLSVRSDERPLLAALGIEVLKRWVES
jgi:hypothetical protein